MKRKPKDPARACRLREKRKLLGLPANPARARREARKVARHDRNFGPTPFQAYLRKQRCVVCGRKPVELAHVRARGMGGNRGPNFWKDNLVPLCRPCHIQLDQIFGKTLFQKAYRINLANEAKRLRREWEQKMEKAA